MAETANDLLIPAGAVNVSALSESFIVSGRFIVNTRETARVKISYVGTNFQAWFGEMNIAPRAGASLAYFTLARNAYDREIIVAMGGEEKAETTLAEIMWLMKRQKDGEAGALHTYGHSNIFYVRDLFSVLRAVSVVWYGIGWSVSADGLDCNDWHSAMRVFSRGDVPALESKSCS